MKERESIFLTTYQVMGPYALISGDTTLRLSCFVKSLSEVTAENMPLKFSCTNATKFIVLVVVPISGVPA